MIKEQHTVAAKFLIKSSFERGTLAERVVKIKLVSEIKSTTALISLCQAICIESKLIQENSNFRSCWEQKRGQMTRGEDQTPTIH